MYVKTICSFINPEGAKKVFAEDEDKNGVKHVTVIPPAPLPLSAFPKSVQENIRKRKEQQLLDTIIPGDMNIGEFPDVG